ncbi:hypothetical protein HYU90_01275 [Candidatus Collierbacteria bacterium]|nr:hypothetical protein [Candidatus Collierbacteria bacterium]
MSKKELTFYRENHTKRVKYDTIWIDPVFATWLETVYGSQKKALDHWASVVSLEPADDVAKSLPTGGRVFIYNLKKPFLDSVTGLPCYQIDVKGVGLTKSGYLKDKDMLEPENERRELMWQPWREIYFGYENLTRQKKVVKDLRAARARGQNAPIPLAVLNLKQMVYEGKTLPIDRLRKALEIKWAEDFALVIRGYPVSTTRICDLTQWYDLVTPDHLIPLKTIRTLNWARNIWKKYELPKFLAATKGDLEKNPQRSYFDWFTRSAQRELYLMLMTGLSPCSSYDIRGNVNHTHLQNVSTANTHVEWTPLGHLDEPDPRPVANIYEIIEAEHDAIVNIGACCLESKDFCYIPTFLTFFQQLYGQLREKQSYLTPTIVDHILNPTHPVHIRGDNLLYFLEEYQHRF